MKKSKAIAHFGGASQLAQVCGLRSRQAIYKWPEEVPDLYQFLLYYRSGGQLSLSRRLVGGHSTAART